ncbi:hypothetical protein CS063_13605 [Sporanaerobium hydrogeniformans]|uniref:Uncharacterized protein n=1 Tax=Sporanaerobium hydrogeniformans TaxID=3072179 RepID=A0AC61D9F0_9FIRM|nr:vitamin B12 dependent-methionine synthase activation domain-containing protein [Sporanaerobium hydrogeniformans]PHV69869.1 hypothetical protein CS063_13605 [Sporanaerobium hydrogeniformans]
MEITRQMMREALRYIGIPLNQENEEIVSKVDATYKFLEKLASPKLISKEFMLIRQENKIGFEGTTLMLESKDLYKLFMHCEKVYILAATLGQEVDRQIRLKQKLDMLDALVLDACASVWVDKLCDEWEQDRIESLGEGQFLTKRFSPGYGDVPLACQGDLLAILNAGRHIGLSLTKTQMLLPTKSITAFIGISNQKEKREKTCSTCSLVRSCIYRRRGEKCGL